MKVACLWFSKPAPTKRLAEYFFRYSPQISIRHDRAIFIEIGKCRHLYSEDSFLARAHAILAKAGFSAQIAVGSDITDSLTLARFGKFTIESLPLIALIDFVDPFERDEVLRKSVVSMIDSFRDLGITNMGQFQKIPVASLIARFGILGRFSHQRANLQDFINWPLWVPEEMIAVKKEFAFAFNGQLDRILFELKPQLDHIFARLFGLRKRAMKLQVEINCESISTNPNSTRILNFDFFAPQGSTKGTLRIFQERLTREFEKRPLLSPVESIQTKVTKAIDYESGQKNIFNNQEEKIEQIFSLHNQLIELLGQENVYQAELTEDRRPERSWKKNYGPPHLSSTGKLDHQGILPDRPTYLCRYPIKIEVTVDYVYINKKRYQILESDPNIERISGAWFENPSEEIKNSFDRNYYEYTLEGHQKILVFATPASQHFLHGYYG